jgi:tetratricopeptide (TPR) repeat protein
MPDSGSEAHQATIGVAIITRDGLGSLKNLLDQLSSFDQVVVLDTGSRDGTQAYVRRLGPPFELHEFKWRPRPAGFGPDEWGFSAARNESFRLLKTTHAVWLDTDDVIATVVGGSRVVASAEAAAAAFHNLISRNPDVDLWLMDYVYATDEFGNPMAVLAKERLLKLDVGWQWRYAIHEALFPGRDAKDVEAVSVIDLVIVHRPHDAEKSKRRNGPMLRAWLRQLERTGASDHDLARARFLVGRSLRGQERFAKAAHWMLSQYLAKHPELPPDDKWEGWMDVAKDLIQSGDREGARHAALQAIGLCPRFGEAYVVLADMKLIAGERPGDILKLLEIADSCANESYGPHEHNPLLTNFNGALIGSECMLRLGRYQQALSLANRALALRPRDERAQVAWKAAADGSRQQITEIKELGTTAPASPTVTTRASRVPVFVVSSGRCGSTLVSNMLRLHPAVLSLSEFLILLTPGAFPGGTSPIYGPQFWSLLSTPRKRMSFMLRHDIVFDEILYRPGPERRFTAETGVPPILLTALPHLTDEPEALYDEIHDFVLAQGAYPVGQHYVRLFDWLCERLGRKVWVERSGSSLVHLGEMMEQFPDARYVHLYRDGRECAISMAGHSAFRLASISGELQKVIGFDPYNSDETITAEVPDGLQQFLPQKFDREAFWKYDVPVEVLGGSWAEQERMGMQLLAQIPFDRVLQLRYEHLVANPEGELTRLMRFIGAPDGGPDYLRQAAALVKVKAPAWPNLPDGPRERLDEVCRLSMGLLYGSEVLEAGLRTPH